MGKLFWENPQPGCWVLLETYPPGAFGDRAWVGQIGDSTVPGVTSRRSIFGGRWQAVSWNGTRWFRDPQQAANWMWQEYQKYIARLKKESRELRRLARR